jgi:hypothetical protein
MRISTKESVIYFKLSGLTQAIHLSYSYEERMPTIIQLLGLDKTPILTINHNCGTTPKTYHSGNIQINEFCMEIGKLSFSDETFELQKVEFEGKSNHEAFLKAEKECFLWFSASHAKCEGIKIVRCLTHKQGKALILFRQYQSFDVEHFDIIEVEKVTVQDYLETASQLELPWPNSTPQGQIMLYGWRSPKNLINSSENPEGTHSVACMELSFFGSHRTLFFAYPMGMHASTAEDHILRTLSEYLKKLFPNVEIPSLPGRDKEEIEEGAGQRRNRRNDFKRPAK